MDWWEGTPLFEVLKGNQEEEVTISDGPRTERAQPSEVSAALKGDFRFGVGEWMSHIGRDPHHFRGNTPPG